MTEDMPQTPETEAAADAVADAVILAGRVAELEAQLAEQKDQTLRAMAETENVRRRLEQQAEDRGKYAVANFAKDMLQVADNLRRALEAIPESAREDSLVQSLAVGVEMTERELLAALERYGVKPVAGLGARFDPNFHQAVMEVEDPSQPQGTVVMMMQTGYMIHDRLLRPAMVGVSRGGPKAPPPGAEPQADAKSEPDHKVDTRV
jgi:molecular chaperone GrpE